MAFQTWNFHDNDTTSIPRPSLKIQEYPVEAGRNRLHCERILTDD